MEFFDVINTQRAMRRLLPDPVSDEDLWTILNAAIHAPSGGNTQGWNFLVIRDRATKEKLGEWYLDAWDRVYGPRREGMLENPAAGRMFKSADYLANHLADAPVLILATLQDRAGFRADATHGASNLPRRPEPHARRARARSRHHAHDPPSPARSRRPPAPQHPRRRRYHGAHPARPPTREVRRTCPRARQKVTYWERWGARRSAAS